MHFKRLKNRNGQVLVETAAIMLILVSAISAFLIYIYRASMVSWTEFQLNEALYCEQTKILQSQRYLESKKKNSSGISAYPQIENNKKTPHRRNHHCKVTAQKNIDQMTFNEITRVNRNKLKNKYEVQFKWGENQLATVKAQNMEKEKNMEDSTQKGLLSQLLSFFFQ